MSYDLAGKRIWVAGHGGLVGSALLRRLSGEGATLQTADRKTLDLTDQRAVEAWVAKNRPHAVFAAAAKVGGILANSQSPADFLYQNLAMELNIIHASSRYGVEKLLFLGSSCIYPRDTAQPIREEQLLSGPLEPTNEAYALAKIAGIKLCQSYRRQYGCNFISAMPTNLYGPNDNFHPEHAHVPAALISRFHHAKESNLPKVAVWGTGEPRREFLFVDDLADACVFLVKEYSGELPINVGTGEDVKIKEFAETVKDVVGFKGELVFDSSLPDGTPRKLLDVRRLTELGWRAATPLREGLELTYRWYLAHLDNLRAA